MKKVPMVWDARYSCDAAPLLSTTKQARVVALAEKAGLVERISPPARGTDAIFRSIAAHHHADYVEAVRSGQPRALAERQGFTWSPEFATSVAQIWHGHQFALSLLREHPLVLHPVSGAHHAHPGRGAGFCTFNYLIGAARRYLAGDERCLIIDLDAHYGDGTAAFIQEDERFQMFDIHGGASLLPAVGSGVLAFEVGHATDYLSVLRGFLPVMLNVVKPTFVQYLAGADPFEQDMVGSIKSMSVTKLADRDAFVIQQVRQRGIPMVVTLAGGYVPGTTEKIHVNTIRAMQEAL